MLFTVTCPGCGTDFPVDPRKVPEDGVYAQCSVCPQIFWVDREMLIPAPVATVTVQPRSGGAPQTAVRPAAPPVPSAVEPAPAAAPLAPPDETPAVEPEPIPAAPEKVVADT
ncbi:MAG: zinc-ribbon domain-containing protein, partial [Gemmatimonadetes bacterium]|nr:zinc-ribbon domain-containing protein [Gemmatimonadota bacterium]